MGAKVGLTYSHPEKARPYAEALRAAGLEPVPLKAGEAASIEGLDGLLIGGGCDINPRLYNQAPDAKTGPPENLRDELEMRLLGQALERDLPVLAICRGMQLFNAHQGGSLKQHIEGHEVRGEDASLPAHTVIVAAGTRLAAILGAGSHPVNSRHHQAVDRVGEGLTVSARSEDGTIEALERGDKRFAVAVQWHPEDQVGRHPAQRKLFASFARAISG